MAKLKAEFLQQYYDSNGVPLRSRLIANFSLSAKLGSIAPGLYNFAMTNKVVSKWVKNFAGFALERSMPTLADTTLKSWFKTHNKSGSHAPETGSRRVYLFCDEFTNYNDVEIGKKAILLLERLGYEVIIPEHEESGRSWMSKGLIRHAKGIANRNIAKLRPLISDETPLIGIEPSAILTFRDEYIDLAEDDLLDDAKAMAQHVYLIDEFLAKEISLARISTEAFTKEKKQVKLHGHCQQKAISSVGPSVQLLSLPENYTVETIPSGCCGMAGSFGYEKEHYDISMKVGELVLLPAVRSASEETIIAAPGTSCRHQIKDGTGRKAMHPVEVLYEALLVQD
jgi:Fe-S oxidoreductase